jgi:hypothetical protein
VKGNSSVPCTLSLKNVQRQDSKLSSLNIWDNNTNVTTGGQRNLCFFSKLTNYWQEKQVEYLACWTGHCSAINRCCHSFYLQDLSGIVNIWVNIKLLNIAPSKWKRFDITCLSNVLLQRKILNTSNNDAKCPNLFIELGDSKHPNLRTFWSVSIVNFQATPTVRQNLPHWLAHISPRHARKPDQRSRTCNAIENGRYVGGHSREIQRQNATLRRRCKRSPNCVRWLRASAETLRQLALLAKMNIPGYLNVYGAPLPWFLRKSRQPWNAQSQRKINGFNKFYYTC